MTAVESTESSDSATSPSEATPLLPQVQATRRTPLPIGQLTILALVRLCEPIAFTVIFPFINEVRSPSLFQVGGVDGCVDDGVLASHRQEV